MIVKQRKVRMIKANTYSIKGAKLSETILPKNFQENINMMLLAQVVRVYEDNDHFGLAKIRTRGEVARSTRKIYRQKGTGGARHGSRGAPIFVGGGIAHGPKGLKRQLSLPKKMRRKVSDIALSLKAREGNVLVVSGLSLLKKTNEAARFIEKIKDGEKKTSMHKRFTFIISKDNSNVRKILHNLQNVRVITSENVNPRSIFFGGVLIMDKELLEKSTQGKRSKDRTKTKAKVERSQK